MGEDNGSPEGLDSTRTADAPSVESSRTIGQYRLLRNLGEGGMGEVWEAEQLKPVRRRVALKLIKWGMDTKRVVARFEAERQALALMNHPHVAKVFDAGATEQGRPYFVMELVRGEPITVHCDRQRLTTRERLELFMRVCEGVQHAHQKGIIHRDIKPSNVLVQVEDVKRVPKIIDFGVAKATEQRLTERTVATELGQLIGTPAYMSPEQSEMTVEDIDTRTDVYSLGVLLYELLVGALPFDPGELRRAGFDEIRRRVREDAPTRPSTRVSTSGDVSAEVAALRRTEPASLARQLRGDLDWITMKALEKDRTRRYGSPNEMAADVGRHLRSEPVAAGPPSTVYRFRKFINRNRMAAVFASAVLVFLVAFAARERVQSKRIADQRDRANREAAAAKQVSEFLVGLFEVSHPSEARGNAITAREILDKGAMRIERDLKDQPLVQARLMGTMGDVYRGLGLFEPAEALLVTGVARLRRNLGDSHPNTRAANNNLAFVYLGQGRRGDAERLFLETLETGRAADDAHLETSRSMLGLARVHHNQGRYEEAESLLIESLEIRRRLLGEGHAETLNSMNGLASLYRHQRRYEEAETLQLTMLRSARRDLGEDHPSTIMSLQGLAVLYRTQGRYDEAEPLYIEALTLHRRVLGEEHMDTLAARNGLALLYENQGRYVEAEPLLLETLDVQRSTLGEKHPQTLLSMANLGRLYNSMGRYRDSETTMSEALDSASDVLPDGHWWTGVWKTNLGVALVGLQRYEEAERLLLAAHAILVTSRGEESEWTIETTEAIVRLYSAWDKTVEARRWQIKLPSTASRVRRKKGTGLLVSK